MTLANWRDIAMLVLVIEALLGTILILILTLLLASIVRRTNFALRNLLRQGQVHVANIATQTDEISRARLVRPVVRLHAAHASARAFMRSILKSVPLPPR